MFTDLTQEHSAFDVCVKTDPCLLRIDFEVPSLDYLHSTSINFSGELPLPNSLGQPLALVGAAIPCRLAIRSTDRWGTRRGAHSQSIQLFVYRLDYDPTAWLPSGPTQVVFEFAADETKVFETTLIALRPGYAALPIVEVTPKISTSRETPHLVPGLSSGDGPGSAAAILSPNSSTMGELSLKDSNEPWPRPSESADGPPISCETNCTTAGNGALVSQGIDRVTMGVLDPDQIEVWETRQLTF